MRNLMESIIGIALWALNTIHNVQLLRENVMRSVWNHLHRTLTVTLVILTSLLSLRVFLHTYSPLLSLDILVRRSTRGGLLVITVKLLPESSNHWYLGSTVLPGSSSQLKVRSLLSTTFTIPFTIPSTPPKAEIRGSRNTVLGEKCK